MYMYSPKKLSLGIKCTEEGLLQRSLELLRAGAPENNPLTRVVYRLVPPKTMLSNIYSLLAHGIVEQFDYTAGNKLQLHEQGKAVKLF